MRCLGFAEVARRCARASSTTSTRRPSDELHSDYVADEHLQLSAWARDAVALELPEQILCREDCAGLCPVCGKDLNEEPHEHSERTPDPRWAALASSATSCRGEIHLSPYRSDLGSAHPASRTCTSR